MNQSKYRVGMKLGSVVVRAVKGFNIKDTHKFDAKVFELNDRMLVRYEYCEPCSKLRSAIGIKGAELDYVKKAIETQPIATVEDFLPRKLIFHKNFRHLVRMCYEDLIPKELKEVDKNE